MLLHNLVTPSITEIPHLRYMRPFVYFSLFYAATLVAADHTEHIDSQDERISYSKDWKFINRYGATLSFNDKGSGTASLKVYNVSRMAVSVFVQEAGQAVRISLDDKNYDVKPLQYQQPAWTSESLDPSVPHELVIIKRNHDGQYVALDYISVTYYDPPTTTGGQVTATASPTSKLPNQLMPSVAVPAAVASPSTQTTSMGGLSSSGRLPSDSSQRPSTNDASSVINVWTNSDGFDMSSPTSQSSMRSDPSAPLSFTSLLIPEASTTSSTQQPNTESVLSGGKLAAVILACIAAPTLVIVGIILYRRRMLSKRKAASTAYLEWMAAHGQMAAQPVFSPTPPDEKFGGAEDVVQPGSPISDSADSHTVAATL